MRKLGIALLLVTQLGAGTTAHARWFGRNKKKAEQKQKQVAAENHHAEVKRQVELQQAAEKLSKLPMALKISESIAAQREGKEYPTASWMWGWEGPPKVFAGKSQSRLRIVYLHADTGGQADTPSVEKLVAGLRGQGIEHDVISIPWSRESDSVGTFLSANGHQVVLVADGPAATAFAKKLHEKNPWCVQALVEVDSAPRSYTSSQPKDAMLPTLISLGAAPSLVGIQLKYFLAEELVESGGAFKAKREYGKKAVVAQPVHETKPPELVIPKPMATEVKPVLKDERPVDKATFEKMSMLMDGIAPVFAKHDKITMWLPVATATHVDTKLVEPVKIEPVKLEPVRKVVEPDVKVEAGRTGGEEDHFKRQLAAFGRAWDGEVVHFPTKNPHPVRVLYFHGGGAKTKDGIIERIADAMNTEGVPHEIFSLPYDSTRGQVDALIAASPGKVILAGHSLGGGYVVRDLMQRHSHKIQASFLINPVDANLSLVTVPTLVIRGSKDSGRSSQDDQYRNVKLFVAEGGDHSLRYRLNESDDRQLANVSSETKAMNLVVAKQIASFLATTATAQ